MIAIKLRALHPLVKIVIFSVAIMATVSLQFFNPTVSKALFCLYIIFISLLLLKTEGRSIESIGIKFKLKSLTYLAVGAVIGVGMLFIVALLTKGMEGFSWQFNSAASIWSILLLFNFMFWSSLVEELWFRGYGFQRLAEYKGKWLAFIVVGILFGLYHINFGMPMPMILITILTTGILHVFWGLAVLKTNNLALPVGLHMGFNIAQNLFPRHPSLNHESSILHIVQTEGMEYSTFSLLLPYLAVSVLGCLFFLVFYNSKSSK